MSLEHLKNNCLYVINHSLEVDKGNIKRKLFNFKVNNQYDETIFKLFDIEFLVIEVLLRLSEVPENIRFII